MVCYYCNEPAAGLCTTCRRFYCHDHGGGSSQCLTCYENTRATIRALIWGCATLVVVTPVAFIVFYLNPFREGAFVRGLEAILYSPFIGIVAAILVAVWKKLT